MLTDKEYSGEQAVNDCLSFEEKYLSLEQLAVISEYQATENTIIELDAFPGNQYTVRIREGKVTTIVDPDIPEEPIEQIRCILVDSFANIYPDSEGMDRAVMELIKYMKESPLG